jgi:hypothetical protein
VTAPVGPITTDSNVYGRLFSASQLEESVADTLKKWFPSYISEVERQLGISPNTLPPPQNYLNRDNFVGEKGEKLPKLVVISQGLTETPSYYGSLGSYSAAWRVGVGIATARTEEQWANRDVKAYGAVIRAILLNKLAVEVTDFNVVEVQWVAENYNDILVDNQIALYKSASVHFTVVVDDVAQRWGGPDEPTMGIPDPLPAVEHVITEFDFVTENGAFGATGATYATLSVDEDSVDNPNIQTESEGFGGSANA